MKYIIKKLFFVFLFFNILSQEKNNNFVVFTSLYNEKNLERICEYIICLESNLKNKMIKQIHILYDKSRDDGKCLLLNYLKNKNVKIDFIKERPTYEYLFNLSNVKYPKSKIIICNADIYFDETLNLLSDYNLNNTFIGLTRWDVNKGGSTQLFMKASQDTWILQTPIRKFKSDFKLGVLGCDNAIMDQAVKNKFLTINPCLSIKTYHLHLSAIRNYSKKHHIQWGKDFKFLDYSYLVKRSEKNVFIPSLQLLAYYYAKNNNLINLVNLMLPLAIAAELKKFNWPLKEINKANINNVYLGETALSFAKKNKHLELVNLLLDFEANASIKDK